MKEGSAQLNCKPSCDQIIDILPDAFVIIDRNFKIIAANQAYRKRYSVESGDVVGQFCHKVSHHSDVPCSQHGERCPLEEVFESGKPTTVMHIHYTRGGDEEYVQLQAAPILSGDGEVMYMGEYIQNLSLPVAHETNLVGRSPAFLRLTSLLQRVAPSQSTILLLGESGTGKECVAEYIHQYSKCSQGPFVVVDCGTLGENLIESELFGHEKGAFTGATKRKMGLFEAASGGTLFIDEVGELPLALQTKLLRALETGTIRRLGGHEYIQVDVRIIAATNRDPQVMVSQGQFRQDLYYRLAAFPIHVPTLRERKDDIALLAEHFLTQLPDGERHIPLSSEVIEKLLTYDYPGNVRELRNIIERAVILACDDIIRPEHIVVEYRQPVHEANSIPELEQSSRFKFLRKRGRLDEESVLEVLKQTGGHRAQAADVLGVSERTLYRYLKNLRQED